jgi:hypothetical protein
MRTSAATTWLTSGFLLGAFSMGCGTILGIGDLPPGTGDGGTSDATATSTGVATTTGTGNSTGTSTKTATLTSVISGTSTKTTTLTSSGTATITSSGTATMSSTGTSACVVLSTGGLPLTLGYLSGAGGNPGPGGYVYAYDDELGSLACVESSSLCGSAKIAAANPPANTIFGGGIGVQLDAPMGAPDASPMAMKLAATGSGIQYVVTSKPTLGLRIEIDNAPGPGLNNVQYCAIVTAASGTIPWASFNTKCYDTPVDGTALTGPPTTATYIQFGVPSGPAAGTFDFCVEELRFACTLAPNSCVNGNTCVTANGSTSCASPGAGIVGSSCAATADCGAGLECIFYSAGAPTGVCKQWCQLSPTTTSCSSGSCIPFGEVVDGVTYGYCSTTCDLAPNTCAAGSGCIRVAPPGIALLTDCSAPGPGPEGFFCSLDTDCAAGYYCNTNLSSCEQWCQLSPAATACTSGSACSPFTSPEVVGGITYGSCQ